ncbi:hypothetical protein ES703_52375 [subsurface metagenome]
MEVNEIPEIGKISPAIFNELIFPRLGAKSEEVLVSKTNMLLPNWREPGTRLSLKFGDRKEDSY